MSRKTKWGIGVGILLVAGVWGGVTAAKRGNQGTEVRMEEVARRDLVASVTASGQVEPRTKVDLTADISGRIVRLSVKEGQMVSRGQFLLEIDPVQYQAGVQRAEAGLAAARAQEAQARANLEQARSNLARSEEIRKANPTLVSAEQLEQLKTTLEVNEALYQSARHNIEQSAASLRDARSSLSKTVILAPMAGRITRLNVELGETAVPGTFNMDAATLLTIADMSVLETKIKVDETDVARISLGDSAMVEIDAFPDTSFVGRVVEISNSSIKLAAGGPQGQDQAVDYEVRVQLLNPPSETRPDFSATAKIVTDTRKNALAVPIIALTVREHETSKSGDSAAIALGREPTKQVGQRDVEGVFIVGKDNKVSFRPVRVGIAGEEYFEVIDGLQPGEKIVAGSYQAIRELRDGATVREAKQEEKKPAEGAKA
jgi:HlyD family secretion protein